MEPIHDLYTFFPSWLYPTNYIKEGGEETEQGEKRNRLVGDVVIHTNER